jgi:hypothetical protein
VHEDIRFGQLLKGCPESGDELGRQLLDESHRVGQQHFVAGRQMDASRHRVERREKEVLGKDFSAGEGPHQRALARVRVADERRNLHALTGAAATVEGALLAHVVDLAPQACDPVADKAAVSLNLGLTGAAGANAAFKAFEVAPLARETGQQVLRLRQLNLQARLSGLGATGEDIDDQGCAVEDFYLQRVLQVALLRRRQLVIEHNEGIFAFLAVGDDLFELALANIGCGVRGFELLDGSPGNLGACRECEQLKLIKRGFRVEPALAATRLNRDEIGALLRGGGGMSCRLLGSLLQVAPSFRVAPFVRKTGKRGRKSNK